MKVETEKSIMPAESTKRPLADKIADIPASLGMPRSASYRSPGTNPPPNGGRGNLGAKAHNLRMLSMQEIRRNLTEIALGTVAPSSGNGAGRYIVGRLANMRKRLDGERLVGMREEKNEDG